MQGANSVVTLNPNGYKKVTINQFNILGIEKSEYTARSWIESMEFKKSRYKKSCEICGDDFTKMDVNTRIYRIDTNQGLKMICSPCAERLVKMVDSIKNSKL